MGWVSMQAVLFSDFDLRRKERWVECSGSVWQEKRLLFLGETYEFSAHIGD